ncbi:MAG: hypothetical protein CVV64_05835 [Candidatus Wallbacteria bacterium HGW-Wallbacteria-1]|jgi:peptidoglycan/xylan/chitin deacetylase (PgdA/CDA1 family)|uniref:NodB homology domain-containing protein n=1 Tax=Candidatus Wallbacteria bacterium HGW-Wallbacteria-1 TaxID=2013854 RepID=A0A2N1PSI1_9BACT|nr:MAG: hypothetical protein CVV64_05835 [Candidatus Wallbacteria bacterium HGW-Wallbacteria-1]
MKAVKFVLLLLALSIIWSSFIHFRKSQSPRIQESKKSTTENVAAIPEENYLDNLFQFARESADLRKEFSELLDKSRSSQTPKALFMAYNHVGGNRSEHITKRPAMSPLLLKKNLTRVSRMGLKTITLSEWYALNQKKRTRASNTTHQIEKARPMAILIFNDGYREHFSTVYPMLRTLKMKATFFVIPSLIGKRIKGVEFMSWDMLREMAANGMEIGSHSMTHPSETEESSKISIDLELAQSKLIIETKLGQKISFFSVPRNTGKLFSPDQIHAAGYLGTVNTEDESGLSASQYLKVIGYL